MSYMQTDVAIIGGGIVGASSAYYLARRGLHVALFEARDLAYGASGRNLGYIWLHSRRPGPELSLAMTTRKFLSQLPEELDYDFELQCNGGMIFYKTEAQLRVMEKFVQRRNEDGVEMRLLDPKEAREFSPLLPENILGATYSPLDAQINPAQYVRAFATAAKRLGAQIHTGTPVKKIILENGRISGVEIAEGRVSASTVLLAAGGWTPQLAQAMGLNVPIYPMRLQVVSTSPMPRMTHALIYGAVAVKQYRIFQNLPDFDASAFEADYESKYGMPLLQAICQTRAGNILLGCPMDYPGFVWEPDLRGIAMTTEAMLEDIPALRGASFERAWAGILPYTSDNLPIIDYVPDYNGLMIASGHVFGNAAGPSTGLLVSELISGTVPSIDPLPFRFDRPSLIATPDQSRW